VKEKELFLAKRKKWSSEREGATVVAHGRGINSKEKDSIRSGFREHTGDGEGVNPESFRKGKEGMHLP